MINTNVDSEGIATLEWDLPGRSQNVLNEQTMAAFADGRAEGARRSRREGHPRRLGEGRLHRRRRPRHAAQGHRRPGHERQPQAMAQAVPHAGGHRQAGGGGVERHHPRWRPGTRAGLPLPRRLGQSEGALRLPRGHAGPAARRRRHPARAAPDGHPGSTAVPHRGQAHQGRRGAEAGPASTRSFPPARSATPRAHGCWSRRRRTPCPARTASRARPCSPGTRKASGFPAAAS
jgi:hypothetical protein